MILLHNPTPETLERLIRESQHKAAKWIKDDETGETWYWPAEMSQHAKMAEHLGITKYTKGLAVID